MTSNWCVHYANTMPKKKTEEAHVKSTFDASLASDVTPSTTGKKRRTKVIIGASFILIVIFGTGLNLFLHSQKSQNAQKNAVVASEAVQEAIVAKVGKLIELPNTEAPTIATVTDSTKLKGQAFFQHAKNGDIVLIYPKANEAILYDPADNRIMQLGPINNNQQAVAGAATKAEADSPTIAAVNIVLYNGTTINGLTKKTQTILAQTMPNVTVVENTNASKQDYANTVVIDLTGKKSDVAKQLATVLHGTVGTMPATETVPTNADILVILGKNN